MVGSCMAAAFAASALVAAFPAARGQADCDLTQLENAVELCAQFVEGMSGGDTAAAPSGAEAEEDEVLLHVAFFLLSLLLVIGFLGGYVLERKHFHYIHEVSVRACERLSPGANPTC